MRNKYSGKCFCGQKVKAEEGYIQRDKGKWLIRCMDCVVKGKVNKGRDLSEAQLIYLTQMKALADYQIKFGTK